MTVIEQADMVVSIPVNFRTAVQSDLPKLEWYGQYSHYRNLFRRAFREQQVGKRLMLIADSNDFPIGHVFIQFISAERSTTQVDRRAYLYSLRVMEMFRGYGIGTRLIQEAENAIHDREFEWAAIAVAKDNLGARRLYERVGYRIFAEDAGRWSYTDHEGHTRQVQEPCWLLQKRIPLR